MCTGFFLADASLFGGSGAHAQRIIQPVTTIGTIPSCHTTERVAGSSTFSHHRRPGHGHFSRTWPDRTNLRQAQNQTHRSTAVNSSSLSGTSFHLSRIDRSTVKAFTRGHHCDRLVSPVCGSELAIAFTAQWRNAS